MAQRSQLRNIKSRLCGAHSLAIVTLLVFFGLFTASCRAAAGTHMRLTWDFYNDAPSDSFVRYHLAVVGYQNSHGDDISLLYDWFDWTQGEHNTHALTPWGLSYAKPIINTPARRDTFTVSYLFVANIVDHLGDFKNIIISDPRLTYATERSLGATPATRLKLFAAVSTPGALAETRVDLGAALRHDYPHFSLTLGLNDFTPLDNRLFNAGRIPLTLGLDVPWSPACTMHVYASQMCGPEPSSMPSRWIRSTSPVILRMGWDFKML